MKNIKQLLCIALILCAYNRVGAQNEQIAIEQINGNEFAVSSINGIPYTIVLESSNNDGQFNLASTGNITFKIGDVIPDKSTLRIVFEEDVFRTFEGNLIQQYHSDIEWISSSLDIPKNDLTIFALRLDYTDESLEELKGKVFEYAETDQKEDYFNQWIEKINYSYGAINFIREIYAASKGEDNSQRDNFLPIIISKELNNK
ncbi:hypothetical protein [Aquimarina sp. AU474]|uniref:hypothetical protein n=1 Tax=Aquimarina sp. AU474 TaxID=2108529 RepID=UPI001358471F|nr:hypothetical protein [Aquimarina sp. AU474]